MIGTQRKTEITHRRLQVSEMYLRGVYQSEIAAKLGVDQATISRDLAELRKEWLDRSVNHIDQRKAIELAKIDRLELEYWAAWDRSKENAEVEVVEQIGSRKKIKSGTGDNKETIEPERIKKYKRTEGQSGNPAFLAGVLSCIDKRCEILGLNAPKRTDLTSGGEVIKVIGIGVDTDKL